MYPIGNSEGAHLVTSIYSVALLTSDTIPRGKRHHAQPDLSPFVYTNRFSTSPEPVTAFFITDSSNDNFGIDHIDRMRER